MGDSLQIKEHAGTQINAPETFYRNNQQNDTKLLNYNLNYNTIVLYSTDKDTLFFLRGDFTLLGQKIRQVRKEKELTLDMLSEKTQFTSSYISQIERDLVEPSLSSLRKIAFALEVPITSFLVEDEETRMLVRANERKKMKLPDSNVIYEFLTPHRTSEMNRTMMDVIYLNLHAKSWDSDEYLSHQSDECLYVEKGTIEVHEGTSVYCLTQGDSLYIKGFTPHKYYNPTDEDVIGISIICPALY